MKLVVQLIAVVAIFLIEFPVFAFQTEGKISADEYRTSGDRYRHLGKPLLALSQYTKALEIDANDIDAIYYSALMRVQLKEYDVAVKDVTRGVKLLSDKHSPATQVNFLTLELRAHYLRYITGSR